MQFGRAGGISCQCAAQLAILHAACPTNCHSFLQYCESPNRDNAWLRPSCTFNDKDNVQVGAPEEEEEQNAFSPPFSPSPSPRGLMPERSFVDESGRVLGGNGPPQMGSLGVPRLDARLVAVFSPRSMLEQASNAGAHAHGVGPPPTPLLLSHKAVSCWLCATPTEHVSFVDMHSCPV